MPVVSREEWKLFRVRPANHPSRRLEGMAALLDRAWDAGLAAWSAALVAEGSVAAVRGGLAVAPPSCALRTGFDRLRANGSGGALIGADRASDLAVNVVLPFARAWGNLNARWGAVGGGAGPLPGVAPAAGKRDHGGGRCGCSAWTGADGKERCGARARDGSRG